MKKVLFGCILLSCCSCSGLSTLNMGQDHFVMAGTPEGIRAFNDGQSGLITNAVNPATKSAYYQLREQETAVKGLRITRGAKK